jgi:uncharacterized protein (DUF1499 family)
MTLLLIVVLLPLAVIAAGQLGLLKGTAPNNLGLRDGRLKPPSKTPNSVTSQAGLWADHPMAARAGIAPLRYTGDGPAAMKKLAEVLRGLERTVIVTEKPDYLYAQCTTALLKFTDDVEFALRLGLALFLGQWLDVQQHFGLFWVRIIQVDGQAPAFGQATEQQFVGQRTADRVLDEALHRAARPSEGSKPFLARCLRSLSVKVTSTFFSASWVSSCSRNLSTTRRMMFSSSDLKLTMASRRLRNSGVNRRLMSAISSP